MHPTPKGGGPICISCGDPVYTYFDTEGLCEDCYLDELD